MNVKVVPSMMADNVHRKSHKLSDANRKLTNPINRTTTETIRLGEPGGGGGGGVGVGVGVGGGVGVVGLGVGSGLLDCKKLELDRRETLIDGRTGHQGVGVGLGLGLGLGLSVPSNITIPNNQCRKKTSSFQITSVTVGNRMSNDAGDDSNDDLDESHGEDNSVELSRITDIETPSYSEDTFSKEDVFFNTSNAALSTAPVIPTSSQYGLAIVPSSEGGNVNNSTNDNNINTLDITSVTDNNIINLLSSNAKQDNDIRDVHSHSRNERFKVVKIESTEPFKRGRWTCMDYLDHTSVNNQSNNPSIIPTSKVSDPNEICISYGVNDAGGVVSFDSSKQSNINEDQPAPTINALDMNGHATHQDIIGSVAMTSNNGVYQVNSIPQNVPRNSPTVQQPQPPTQIPQYFQSSSQQQQQQQPPPSQPQAQQQSQQPQQQQQQQQQQTQPPQGATLPANLQNTHPSNLGQPQSMPQGSISVITQPNNNSVTPQQNITHSKDDNTTYVTVNSQNQSIPPPNVCQSSTASSQPSNILVTQHQSQQPSPQQQSTQQQQQPTMTQLSEPINAIPNIQGIQNIVPQSGSPQPVHQVLSSTQQLQGASPPQTGASPQVQINQVPGSCQNVVGGIQQQQQQAPPPNMGFSHQPDTEQESLSGMGNTAAGSQLADAALLECLAEVTQANDDHHTLEDNESMSGTSAVAIDNKIEQAMDLVKSHLMFAVREEVEVLKEKIAELMDRINQLEAENLILKAHATPETLAQLSQATTKLSQNNSGSGQ